MHSHALSCEVMISFLLCYQQQHVIPWAVGWRCGWSCAIGPVSLLINTVIMSKANWLNQCSVLEFLQYSILFRLLYTSVDLNITFSCWGPRWIFTTKYFCIVFLWSPFAAILLSFDEFNFNCLFIVWWIFCLFVSVVVLVSLFFRDAYLAYIDLFYFRSLLEYYYYYWELLN